MPLRPLPRPPPMAGAVRESTSGASFRSDVAPRFVRVARVEGYSPPPFRPAIAPSRSRSAFSLMKPCASNWS